MRLLPIFVIMAMVFPVSASGNESNRKQRGKMQKVLEALQLSPKQKVSISKIHEAAKEKVDIARDKVELARNAFYQGVGSSSISKDELSKLHDAYVDGKRDYMKSRFSELVLIREVLSVQQLSEFTALMSKYRSQQKDR